MSRILPRLLLVAIGGLAACGGSAGKSDGGAAGTPGDAGMPGTAGTQGSAGAGGTQGSAGTAGTQGAGGTQGAAGGGGTAGAGGSSAGAAGRGGTSGAAGNGGSAGTGGAAGRGGTTGGGGRGGTMGAGTGGGGSGGTAGATGRGGAGGTGGTAGTQGTGGAISGSGPLHVSTDNPRYFADGTGKIVYLTGSHTWGNYKDRALTDPPPAFDYAGYLNFLVARNHNFFRLWAWEQTHSAVGGGETGLRWIAQPVFQRTGPGNANDGKPKFDLTKFDPAYFSRLRQHVMDAGARGIYVAIMLFDGYDMVNVYNGTDGGFPYASGNNINSVAADGPTAVTLSNTTVTGFQDAYVKQVIDTVDDLDNVLYEIANEPDSSGIPWEKHMITLIKQYEATKPKQHPVGFTVTYPGSDDDVLNSAADWVSPNTQLLAGDGKKVILNDTDHSYYWSALQSDGQAAQQQWAWKTLAIGAQPMFMDPYLEPRDNRNNPSGTTPDTQWDRLRNALGRTRIYADKMDLKHAVPSGSLSSTNYCLAYPGNQYLVYQPSSGAFTLTVTAGTYNYEWYNPTTGAVAGTGSMTLSAGSPSFTPPFSGDAVLLLTK